MGILNRLSNLFRRDYLHQELDEELQFHLDSRTRDNLHAGMSPEAARNDARRRFGNRTLAQERTHEVNVVAWLETTAQDAGYALRSLRKSPGFTTVAILTLALGMGANTAVFTVVDGVLLRPLPFPHADRLCLISYRPEHGPFQNRPGLSDHNYLEFERQDRSFERVATFGSDSLTLTGAEEAVRVPVAAVTSGFFPVLEVNPALGRTFLPEEDHPANHSVAVLSDKLWRNRFGADPNILGRTITLDGVSRRVIGVMPAQFAFPIQAELWLPLGVGEDRGNSYFRPVIGRLKPSVSIQQARAAWESFAVRLPIGKNDRRSSLIAEILPLKDLLTANIRKSLLIFMGAVAFVLLIACANVANLLLMRGTARQQEIAVRATLGASRGRLIRQLLTESTVVSLSGSLAGLAVALLGVPGLLALAPEGRIPRVGDIHVDGRVLAFTLGLGALTGILFGLVPAIETTGRRVRSFLSASMRSATPRRERLRNSLAVAEIALALVLLTGAGLMVKSFLRMRAVNPGFHPENVLALTVDFPEAVYRTPEAIQAYDARALARLSSLPGVIAAGGVNWVPFRPMLVRGNFHVEDGRPMPSGYLVDKPAVTPDYFRALGIRLAQGRTFTNADNASAPPVAIITRSVARTLWPGADPVGQRISLEDNPKSRDWLTIVGVVEDVRQRSLTDPPEPAIYQPYQQVTRTFFLGQMTFAIRTVGDPQYMASAMRASFRRWTAASLSISPLWPA